ncbi:unnamed protein product [Gongylonema pulchrum]|uniref:Exocyst complex component 5 n=1 Tax=Gongylonema pulchrum TaxID=637853 RepID=A0A183E2K6_9BILA|nr:unnamed protein product [Gongylonema pulchrum]
MIIDVLCNSNGTFFSDTPVEDVCAKKQSDCLRNVENRINLGLERQLNVVVGYIRFLLSSEQKKTDFRPEDENQQVTAMSCVSFSKSFCLALDYFTACAVVVKYLTAEVQIIRDSLDGGNLTSIMLEFGRRFYKVFLNHIYQFTYNSQGAMLLLCDINEYRKCVMSWKIPDVDKQFESLHALANLLVVVPENLNEACSSQLLVDIDRTMVNSFIQLRVDYRSAKLHLNAV